MQRIGKLTLTLISAITVSAQDFQWSATAFGDTLADSCGDFIWTAAGSGTGSCVGFGGPPATCLGAIALGESLDCTVYFYTDSACVYLNDQAGFAGSAGAEAVMGNKMFNGFIVGCAPNSAVPPLRMATPSST